jgi:hypothetical protein
MCTRGCGIKPIGGNTGDLAVAVAIGASDGIIPGASAPRTTLPDDMRGAFTTPWIPRNGGQKLTRNFGKISKPGFLTEPRHCLIFLPGPAPPTKEKL